MLSSDERVKEIEDYLKGWALPDCPPATYLWDLLRDRAELQRRLEAAKAELDAADAAFESFLTRWRGR